jgi:hypothetical protein
MAEEKIVWAPLSKPQTDFCKATETEVLFGGAKGCAKSDAILFAALSQIHLDRYKALILRQTFPEVQELIDRSQRSFPEMANPPKWAGDLKRWTFPGGGILQFGYCKTKDEVQRYHGQEWAYIGFDEVGDVPDERVWVMLMAENRCPNPEVIRMMRGTANPGKPGHPWVKRRFIDKCGKLGEKIYRFRYEMPGGLVATMSRRFIPARVTDNPIYANDAVYMANLFSLPEMIRRQLLYGDWDAGFGMALDELSEDVHLVQEFEIPPHWTQFGSFDWGFAHPWVFGHYAVNEDGVIFKIATYTGRLMSDRLIGEQIKNYVDVNRLEYIVAGHDCWAHHGARRDDTTPSTHERFSEQGIYLTRASVARYAGLRNFREQVAYKGRLSGGEDGEPNFYILQTPGNMKCFESLQNMIVNPDDPEDALKINADPITGEGGDDHYDETRYALASRPTRPKSTWQDQEVRAFSRETLLFEMEKSRRHRSPLTLDRPEDQEMRDLYVDGMMT